MKIIKSDQQTRNKPKCAGCGHWKIFLHCKSVGINGCDTYWCIICWPEHSKEHDNEWQNMSQEEKDKMIYG